MSTEGEAIADFKYRTIKTVKSLTPSEARLFLKGVLLCADHDVEDLRAAYGTLCNFDDQLELIEEQQLKFRELLKA